VGAWNQQAQSYTDTRLSRSPLPAHDVYCEVKEFEFAEEPNGFPIFDSRAPIREKITKAEGQFRSFRAHPCCLVLFNGKRLLFLDNPVEMYGVMFGEETDRECPGAGTKFSFEPRRRTLIGPDHAGRGGEEDGDDGSEFGKCSRT
jgi:hypothetical protein